MSVPRAPGGGGGLPPPPARGGGLGGGRRRTESRPESGNRWHRFDRKGSRRRPLGDRPGSPGRPARGRRALRHATAPTLTSPAGGGGRSSLHLLMAGVAFSISIVIPTLNAGRAFGTVLHRIMGQGCTPLEIVCADSGSHDGTRHSVSHLHVA